MKMKSLIALLAMSVLLVSCGNEVLDDNMDESTGSIVVEWSIDADVINTEAEAIVDEIEQEFIDTEAEAMIK